MVLFKIFNNNVISKLRINEYYQKVLRTPTFCVIRRHRTDFGSTSCQVKVSQGVLQGKECKTVFGRKYFSFEGIPYAKPPLGELRYKNPEEPENWSGIRDATKPGDKCCQVNPFGKPTLEGSEDCLYLNVYTPSLPQDKIEKLPVLFFIHGGRCVVGYGDYYKPDYLLKQDVVLVTINYRLNVLGFLCLNIPEAPGNAGMKDSVMALRWVKQNINIFNGDPNNVTAMGESAGGATASSFLTSDMPDGLYHKIICQSGVSVNDVFLHEREDPIEKAKVIASSLGKDCKDERSLYDFFVNAPINDLVMACHKAETSRPPYVVNGYLLPIAEQKFDNVERFFAEFPRIDMALNRFKTVPCLFGMNSHEGGFFLRKDKKGRIYYEQDFFYFMPSYLGLERGDDKFDEVDKKLRQFYFKGAPVDDNVRSEYIDLLTDRFFNVDVQRAMEIISQRSELYFYMFKYNGNMNTTVMKNLGIRGTSHGDMLQYLFYRKSKHDQCTEEDLKMVDILTEAWYNFAKNGTPSWSGQETKWLPYTPTDRNTLLIDNEIRLVQNPHIRRFKFWKDLIGAFGAV